MNSIRTAGLLLRHSFCCGRFAALVWSVIGLLCFSRPVATAADYVWGGGISNWNDTSPSGWNGGPPASGSDTATITNGTVTLDYNNQANGVASITIGGTGKLSQTTNNGWNQLNNLTLQGGTLESVSPPNAAFGSYQLPGTVTVSGSSPSTISTKSGANTWINLGLAVNNSPTYTTFNVADVTASPAADLTVSTALADNIATDFTSASPAGLIKTGNGTLALTGTNTYAAGTTVNAGTLQLTANGGNCPIIGTLTVNPGGTVVTTGDGTGLGFNPGRKITTLNINGGTVSAANKLHVWNLTGGVNLTGGTLSASPLEWGDTVVNTSASGTSAVIGGQINIRADANSANASLLQLIVADGPAATDLLISANITQTGLPSGATTGGNCGISKTGAGTLRLTGSVQISGVISVEAGTLDFAPSAVNTNARIWMASSASLLLSSATTNTVKSFYIGGVKKAAGRWGAVGSVAAGKADFESALISGPGVLRVTDNSVANRDRWKRMKYGQFTHYLYFGILPDGTSYSDVNFAADNFNATKYANDLQSMGVEYVIFTAWHANFVPMFNSAAVVRALGFQRNSTRDMIGDMLAAVRAKGIRVLLYTHPNQPVIYDYAGHNNMINDVYGELVDRYGDQIDGLYLDENDPGGNQNNAVDFPRLERTIHRRNPDLILLQNFYGNLYACDVPIGESGPQSPNLHRDVAWASVSPYAQVMSATWNVSVPTNTFAATRSAVGIFRAAVMAAGTCTEGGGWAWAAGPFPGGLWEQGVLEAMQGAAQLMAPVAVAVTNTFPSTSWPVFGVSITGLPYGVVATRSVDDTREYIHVLNPPGGSTLTLPPAADGKVFTNARLLANSNAVTLAQSSRGVQLTLTGTNTWDANDTVIALDVVSQGDKGIYNNTSPSITYTGSSWSPQGNRGLGEYRNDVHVATANGDSFTFNFTGTDVSFISSRGSGRGVVALSLDGVLVTNLDLSVGSTNRAAVFSLTGLTNGPHTLTGVKVSGSYLYVDAFKVSEMLNDTNAALVYGALTRFNNTDSTPNALGYITYTGSWSWQQRYGGEYNGDITWSQTPGNFFTIYFNGTGVRMIGNGLGTIDFYLDGTFIKTVNMNAGGNVVGVVGFSTNGLPAGSHQLKGVVAGGPYVQVDEFNVVNSVNSAWSYQANRNMGDYQNDIHTTANTYDQVNLNFNGTGVEVLAPTSSAGGTVQVFLDGSVVENVNQYVGDLRAQATTFSSYNVANLTPGSHQLQLLKPRNFGSMAVDAVRIYKGETVASAPVYWGATGNGGSGTWNVGTSANWWDGANTTRWYDFGGVDYAAVFAGTAGTVSLASSVKVNRLTFNTTGYTLQNNTLNLNGSNPGVTVASNVTAIVASSITGSSGLTKDGSGTLQLNGINSYAGGTTVNGGALLINGSIGGGVVTVGSGAVLGGQGNIGGPVTIQSGAALAPGMLLGTLTISNTLTLQTGSQTVMQINAASSTNDQVRGLTTVNYGGTLVITNLAGGVSAGQTFQLFSAASRTGNFSAITGAPGTTWSFNPTNGVLTALTTVALNPTNLTASVSGTNLSLSWPADHIGWTLIMQTNKLTMGLSLNPNDWMRVQGSSATNSVVVPILPTTPGGYYRLVYP